jgi:hypothetical protein
MAWPSPLERLRLAELAYKATVLIAADRSVARETLPSLQFSWGPHVVSAEELSLTAEEEQIAAGLLEHLATYSLCLEADSVLAELIPQRFELDDDDLRCAAWIVRLIRNAFAHDPFAPTWLIDRRVRDAVLQVHDILTLDTCSLPGKVVRREDYGGPLALLRLIQFVGHRVASTTNP